MDPDLIPSDAEEPPPIRCGWCQKTKPEYQFPWRRFASGLRRVKICFVCKDKKSQNRRQWLTTDAGKAWSKRCSSSTSIQESKRKHRLTDLYIETTATYNDSEAGRAASERKRQRLIDNPNDALMLRLSTKMGKMVRGERHSSSRVTVYSGFENGSEIREHLQSTTSLDLDDKTVSWQIDHRIAKVWYAIGFANGELQRVDISDDEMKKCWHKDNLCALSASENRSKSIHLPEEATLSSLKHLWPAHWLGRVPSEEYTKALWKYVNGGKRAGF